MNHLDWVIAIGLAFMAMGLVFIIWNYAKGLKGSPRELYLLFISKIAEYSCYGAINLAFVLFLSADVGLNDIQAGSFVGTWSILLTVMTMIVGSIVDAVGVKKTLLFGTVVLIISRFFLPFFTNIYLVTLFAFIPMAIGMAMVIPVLSVGIKHFTTKETAALGFGLFYTMLNIGWAIGGYFFDLIRGTFGEHAIVKTPILGLSFSTYQIIFWVGFVFTVLSFISILFMRDEVEMTEDQGVVIREPRISFSGGFISSTKQTVQKAGTDTVKIFKEVILERAFWIFIGMLGLLVFAKLSFYHFHYTFPKYGIRVLGEGLKIGSIFGVLNPVMIIFLTPLIAALTKKMTSYKVMLFGTFISAGAIFLAAVPESYYQILMGTWFSELVFDRWLSIPFELQKPLFLALVIMVALFTIGEAIWSPRLMQFTAEIAPKGKEGSYVALSYLPYFGGKLLVGPLSGWLVANYTPEGASSYPQHFWIWIWMGGMAAISPIGLILFRKLFTSSLHAPDDDEAPKDQKIQKDSLEEEVPVLG